MCGRCLPSWTIYMELLMSERQNQDDWLSIHMNEGWSLTLRLAQEKKTSVAEIRPVRNISYHVNWPVMKVLVGIKKIKIHISIKTTPSAGRWAASRVVFMQLRSPKVPRKMIYTPAFSSTAPLAAIYLILAVALCSRSQHPPPTFFSCPPVVSAWMILCIDSFVHSCRRICTCNRSPVDIGLITALSWHPAASPSSHEPGRPADAAAPASERTPPPAATRAEEKDGC